MKMMKYILVTLFTLLVWQENVKAQDVSFSQTYEAPLYLSPAFAGLTTAPRVGLNYRNQWPGAGKVYRDYSVWADIFLNNFNSGLGLMWLRDDNGKGLLVDNEIRFCYAYEISIGEAIFIRPGISFSYGHRSINQANMISYSDITADGKYVYGGSSIDFENTKRQRFDAGAGLMVYNDYFWVGVAVDHLVQPDVSFTDIKDKLGMKITGYAGYRWVYQESYKGSEPKSISFSINYTHQYSYNQMELAAYWYYSPIEVGITYRGLLFKVGSELSNSDAIIPAVGVNIWAFRVGYSYDMTISDLSGFGNGAHEVSLLYRFLPKNVHTKSYKRKPVPCIEPILGYSYTGKGTVGKFGSKSKRKFFKR